MMCESRGINIGVLERGLFKLPKFNLNRVYCSVLDSKVIFGRTNEETTDQGGLVLSL